MILIVALGNPEPEYAGTRHNLAVAALKPLALDSESKFDSLISKPYPRSEVLLAFPQTFMNESGKSVSQVKNFYKIPDENIWVVHDDVDLPFGTVRVSFNSSAAGHRGVQSVIEAIGTQNFWRIRMGIGRPANSIPTDAYVLQKFTPEEKNKLNSITDSVIAHIASYLGKGIFEETF